MNKHGIFLSIGAFIITGIMITLALVISTNIRASEAKLEDFGNSDRLYDLFYSVEKSVRDVFFVYSPINITIQNKPDGTVDVTFKETLGRSNDDYAVTLNQKLEDFEDFVEAKEPKVDLDTSALRIGQKKDRVLTLFIEPHDIEYLHDASTGQVNLRIEPSVLNFNYYNTLVDTGIQLIDQGYGQNGIRWHISNSGTFNFTLSAKDSSGYMITRQEFINLAKTNEFRIGTQGGTTIRVILDGTGEWGFLKVWTPNVPPEVTFTVNLQATNEAVKVYTEAYLSVNLDDFSKRNLVQIAP